MTARTHARHPEQFAIVRDATHTLCGQHVPSALIVAPLEATCLPCSAIVRAVVAEAIPRDLRDLLVDLQERVDDDGHPVHREVEALVEWTAENVPGRDRWVCGDCGGAGYGFHACEVARLLDEGIES